MQVIIVVDQEKHCYIGEIVQNRLSDIILFHRKQSGLTQIELAELAGVGKNLVYELENGKQSVRLENLLKVLQVLNIELDFQSPLREAFFSDVAVRQGGCANEKR
ncbi:helix-turn-helix transcriptional regulator [Desulfobacterota bacterium M19]